MASLADQPQQARPFKGARCQLTDLARQEFNGKRGIVLGPDSSRPDRLKVQLVTADGLTRDGGPKSFAARNLEITGEAAFDRAIDDLDVQAVEVLPASALAAVVELRPVNGWPMLPPSGAAVEMAERAFLQNTLGWGAPQGLKAYSKSGSYCDYYVYFDAASTGEVNAIANLALVVPYYPEVATIPPGGIRGSVIVVRMEPPMQSVPGGGFEQWETPGSDDITAVDGLSMLVSIGELRDSLSFFVAEGNNLAAIADHRDQQRVWGRQFGGVAVHRVVQGQGPGPHA